MFTVVHLDLDRGIIYLQYRKTWALLVNKTREAHFSLPTTNKELVHLEHLNTKNLNSNTMRHDNNHHRTITKLPKLYSCFIISASPRVFAVKIETGKVKKNKIVKRITAKHWKMCKIIIIKIVEIGQFHYGHRVVVSLHSNAQVLLMKVVVIEK